MLLGVAAHRCLVGVVCSDLTRWTVGTKTDAFFPPSLYFLEKKIKKNTLNKVSGRANLYQQGAWTLVDTHTHTLILPYNDLSRPLKELLKQVKKGERRRALKSLHSAGHYFRWYLLIRAWSLMDQSVFPVLSATKALCKTSSLPRTQTHNSECTHGPRVCQ